MGTSISLGLTIGGSAISGKSNPFIFSVRTDRGGVTASNQFQLPLVNDGNTINAIVDWGDGTSDTITTFNQAETLHTYPSSGTYTITINGRLSGWQFNNGGDRQNMLNVFQWGVFNISVHSGFYGCDAMTCSALDKPKITTDNLASYFRATKKFQGEINNWDINGVTNIGVMFYESNFNRYIGDWDTSNVTSMAFMFERASNFNQDISNWDTSNVTSIINMFALARNFNYPIGKWNTSNISIMSGVFNGATAFNQDISDWDVSNVTEFERYGDFMGGKNSTNYDPQYLTNIYNKWSLQNVNPNLTINLGSVQYYASGQSGKNILTSPPNNWTITDGGSI